MGAVFPGYDDRLDRKVALKVCTPNSGRAHRVGIVHRDLKPDNAIPRLQKLAATAPMARALFYEAEILRRTEPQSADAIYRSAERELATVIAKSSDPSDLALWTRILIRRQRHRDAKAMLVKMRGGQSTAEVEQMCREAGCKDF